MQGLLLLDKPKNKTSYGAVVQIKRIAGEKRVGHTGTLDPMATGVLPVLLGRATALSSYLLDADKRYTARIRLGTETDTCDITGAVLTESPVSVTDKQLDAVLCDFLGIQMQTPPMFSALKKDGVRLYELARQGKTVDIPAREICVKELCLTERSADGTEFTVETCVSKGTYIRSLARDIGRKLGCGATLTELRRTATSGFTVEECVPAELLTPENLAEYLLPAETVVLRLRAVNVTEKQAIRFCNGGALALERIHLPHPASGEEVRVRFRDTFLGIGRVDSETDSLAIGCVIADFRGGDL